MQTIHILAIVSTVLFVAYNIIINVINGKILPSLSDSFYLLNEKKNGLGYAFSVMLFIVVITLIPTAIDITPDVWKFIPFIMCGSLALQGSGQPMAFGVRNTLGSSVNRMGDSITGMDMLHCGNFPCWIGMDTLSFPVEAGVEVGQDLLA